MTDDCPHDTTESVDDGDYRVLRCAACKHVFSRTLKGPDLD